MKSLALDVLLQICAGRGLAVLVASGRKAVTNGTVALVLQSGLATSRCGTVPISVY